MLRRILKITLWTVGSLILFIALLVGLALTSPVQTAVAKFVLKSINNGLSGSLSVGRILVHLNGEVELDDVRLLGSDSVQIVHLDHLRAAVRLKALRRNRIHVRSVSLEGLASAITFDSTGSNLLRALAARHPSIPTPAPAGPAKPSPWRIKLDRFSVQGTTTSIRSPQKIYFASESWTFDGNARYANDSLSYAVHLKALPQLELNTDGKLVLQPQFQPLQGLIALKADSLFLANLDSLAGNAGNVEIAAGFALRGDSLSLNARVNGSAIGKLHVDAVAPYPFTTLAGRGEVTLDSLTPGGFWQETNSMRVNGKIAFTKKADPSLLNGWNADVALQSSHYGEYRLASAVLHIQTHDSTARVEGNVDTGHGRATFKLSADGFDPAKTKLSGDVSLEKVNAHAIVPQVPDSLSPLTGKLVFHARSLDLNKPVADVAVALGPVSLGSYRSDTLKLVASVDGSRIQLDSLFVTSAGSWIRASAEGELKGLVQYTVAARVPDVSEFRAFIPTTALADTDTLAGTVKLDLKGTFNLAAGTPLDLTASGFVQLDSAQFQSYKVSYATLNIAQFNVDSLRFHSSLKAKELFAAGQFVDSLEGFVSGTPQDLSASLNVWARADTIHVGGDARLKRTDTRMDLTLDSLFGKVYGIEFNLDGNSHVTLVGNRVEVDGLTITSNVGVLRAVGTVQKGGQQDVAVELSGIRTGEVGRLLKRPLPESTINLRVQITGPDTALAGDISLTADSLVMNGYSLADEVSLHAAVDRNHSTVDGLVIWLGDTTILFDGDVPARISLETGYALDRDKPISGHLQIREQPLAKVNRYMPQGTMLDGFLSADARFSGTPAAPQWSGEFAVRDGVYRDPRAGIRYEKMTIKGDFDGDTLRIPQFNITSGGTLTGSGTALMGFPLPSELDLNLKFNHFQAVNSTVMRAKATGNLVVSGKLNHLSATGDIRLDEALYRLTGAASKNIEPINVNLELARLGGDTTKPAFSLDQIYRSMAHEIHVEIPGNAWIRGRGMNIELSGEVYTFKQAGEDPAISGQIAVRNGSISVVNTEFRVVSGWVRFDGIVTDPAMDIYAYEPRIFSQTKDSITVHVYGTLKQSQFELGGTGSAGNVLSPSEAATILVSGAMGVNSNSADAKSNALTTAASSAAATATSAATGQVTGALGRLAGLDVLRYNTDQSGFTGLQTGSLEVGTYVTDRLFVRVVQPVRVQQIGKEDVSVEYRLFRWLSIRAQEHEQTTSSFDLIMQVDWR
jgi:autotransporter translocation and assembly factor TamB